MVTFEHKQLIERLRRVETPPDDQAALREWIRGRRHLELLQQNTKEDEIIVAALSPSQTCINSFVASADHPDLQGDIPPSMRWSPNPLHYDATPYSWSYGSDGVHPIQYDGGWSHELPAGVRSLVFGRSMEGASERDSLHYEIAQEYTHASGIHWQPDRHAYSRFDHRGDWMDAISISEQSRSDYADLVSFRRADLELHLVAMNAVLVRVYDLTLLRSPVTVEQDYRKHVDRIVRVGPDLRYREMVNEDEFGFVRGVQVIAPTLTPDELEQLVKNGHIADATASAPVDFIVQDWRNKCIAKVSTDPATTTNYFVAGQNALPYETSPASFRPEVISKYKADSEKYTVTEDSISCRGGWSLRSYWVNDAEQVCAYIHDLRQLPHEEQVHWSLFNHEPKSGIPERVIKTDFRAEWLDDEDMTPLGTLIELLQEWAQRRVPWWRWTAEWGPERLTVPRTGSRDEWAAAFLALWKGVVEGFGPSTKFLRRRLDNARVRYEEQDKSIALLEKIVRSGGKLGAEERFNALREINEVRTHGLAHASGGRGKRLAEAASRDHGSYAAHFEDVCSRLVAELKLIEEALG